MYISTDQEAYIHFLFMSKKLTTKEWIEKAKKIHGNKYDYSNTIYKTRHEKLFIICREHGEFKQGAASHLAGSGCSNCSHLNRAYTNKEFINKARLVHSDLYDYSLVEYKNAKTNIKIICKIKNHGIFQQKPGLHLNGNICPKCSIFNRRIIFSEFLKRAKKIHGNLYIYFEDSYLFLTTKMSIQCSICNFIFLQTPHKHLLKRGCPKCARLNSSFSKNGFIKYCKDGQAILYIIICYNKNEEFYKIGITSKSVNKRYESDRQMPYNYDIISEYTSDAEIIYDLEKELHKKFKNFKYKPKIEFGGYTECFKLYANQLNYIENKFDNI